MKKFCDKCNVEIEETKNFCPLCGRCCADKLNPDEQTNFSYPERIVFINKRRLAFNLLIYFLLLGNLVCIATNLLFSKSFTWAGQVLYGSIFTLAGIIFPAKRSFDANKQLAVLFIAITAYVIVLEITLENFGWGLVYAIPFFYIAMGLYGLFYIIFKSYHKMKIVVPIIELVLLEIGVFVTNLVLKRTLWPSFVALVTGIGLFGFLILFNFKKSKTELEKTFHL